VVGAFQVRLLGPFLPPDDEETDGATTDAVRQTLNHLAFYILSVSCSQFCSTVTQTKKPTHQLVR
jgi:hypothetical protein